MLSDKITSEIDVWVKKFPKGKHKSAIIHALTITQQERGGWLRTEDLDQVADYLKLDRVDVYEVASFYSMFDLKEVGKYKLCICTNISCMLCGSNDIVKHLEKKLKVKMGDTTKDGKFTLKQVECLAACGGAPAMQVGDNYYENLTPEKIDKLLDKLD